jgi:glycosyltransferase involved in cell wall biosynthesis
MGVKISIVMVNFNSGDVLERAIQSLIAQEYPDLQIIMIDACSTDSSAKIIEKYRHLFDPCIIEKDRGTYDGLNKGFTHARGEIFGWLCSDDELLPGALQHVAAEFERNPGADIVTGGCRRIFPDMTVLDCPPNPEPFKNIGVQNTIEQSATFWRAALHRKVAPLSVRFRLSSDWDQWNRFKKAGARIITTPQILSRYHFTETNQTSKAGRLFVTEAMVILRKYGPLGPILPRVYRFLYMHFDLHGCYDRPPTCSVVRSHFFICTLAIFRVLIGQRLLYLYNWHFAACQERGLPWWKN